MEKGGKVVEMQVTGAGQDLTDSPVLIVTMGLVLRDELLLALLAGRVLVVFGAWHGHFGRVALLVQQLLERIQLIALVHGREISQLQHVTTGSKVSIFTQ